MPHMSRSGHEVVRVQIKATGGFRTMRADLVEPELHKVLDKAPAVDRNGYPLPNKFPKPSARNTDPTTATKATQQGQKEAQK